MLPLKHKQLLMLPLLLLPQRLRPHALLRLLSLSNKPLRLPLPPPQ